MSVGTWDGGVRRSRNSKSVELLLAREGDGQRAGGPGDIGPTPAQGGRALQGALIPTQYQLAVWGELRAYGAGFADHFKLGQLQRVLLHWVGDGSELDP